MLYQPGIKRDRQYGELSQIRPDHLQRYLFAASRLNGKIVLDAACGCGYGSWILKKVQNQVTSVDVAPEAISYAQEHYKGPLYIQADITGGVAGKWDALVTFETLEHLKEPLSFLKNTQAQEIYASVPNEERNPFKPENFREDQYPHLRHYKPPEFERLLVDAGYREFEFFCQKDKRGALHPGTDGIFMLAVGRR